MIGPIFRSKLLQSLPRVSLFGGIPRSDVDAFIRPLSTAKFHCGETLFREEDPPGAFYLILEGQATLEIRDRAVATVGQGELLGADALIGIHAQPMTAVSRSPCVVVVISPSAIHRLATLKPHVFAMLMTNIARDFARRIKQMSQLLAPGGSRFPNDPADEGRHPAGSSRQRHGGPSQGPHAPAQDRPPATFTKAPCPSPPFRRTR
jgi:CRP-like cAMP-binding protein